MELSALSTALWAAGSANVGKSDRAKIAVRALDSLFMGAMGMGKVWKLL
jgi:hypothetical protein